LKSKQQQLFEPPEELSAWEVAAEQDRTVAEVVFNRPLETPYSYAVPEALRELITPGQRVKAPFGRGNRHIAGFCVNVRQAAETDRRLKEIESVLDREPLVDSQMLELTRWIADRYLCGWGQVLQSVIPAGVKKKAGTRLITQLSLAENAVALIGEKKLPAKQQAVVDALTQANQPMRIEELTAAANCGTGPIQSLRTKNIVIAHRERTNNFAGDFGDVEKIDDLTLNKDQQNALASIVAPLQSGEHQTLLLHGVTGSGKTEVYIQAIREVVSYGRQAIVLVPEISLTPQTIRRFRSRFDSVAVLHSHMTDSERHWHWQQIARGAIQVIVGARSAVFAPTPQLGLIVIDEEHETTFKQDSTPRYHAREVARKRAMLAKIPLVLGTATPTLESWWRAKQKLDTLVSMPRRVQTLPLPPVTIVDTRNDPRIRKGGAIGRVLHNTIGQALADNGQIILFLNLRGFSPTVWCISCGEGIKCPECDVTLNWHKDRGEVVCHLCDHSAPPPRQCPVCESVGVRYFGIGTQKLEQEVSSLFRNAKVLRMDSDSMRKPGSHDEALTAFRAGEVNVLLGTQMIAKGLDFPNVTLVGVIDADTILHQPDLRATERTFQLLAQVSGRTGRSERGGRVLVQTSSPAEPAVIHASNHDYISFAQEELQHRRDGLAPPFSHLARVIFRGEKDHEVRTYAREFADAIRAITKELKIPVRVLGPAPAPIARVRAHYRYHLQMSAVEIGVLQSLWRLAVPKLPKTSNVEFAVDVDPVNMR
jgi:primosomal protein N' (replication factor Y)